MSSAHGETHAMEVRARLLVCALALTVGLSATADEVPDFHAKSGDEQVLTRARVRGKVLLIWYEGDGMQAENAPLKAALKTFNTTQLKRPHRLEVIPFANVSSYDIWPASAIARSKLRDVSKEIGLTVYGDWDGSVREAFRFVEDKPNVLIADDRGVIRWRATGKVPASRFAEVQALLQTLVDGGPPSTTTATNTDLHPGGAR